MIPPFCSDALAVPAALDVRHAHSSARSTYFVGSDGSIFACVSGVYYQTEESVMNVRSSWNPSRENTNLKLTPMKCNFYYLEPGCGISTLLLLSLLGATV